MKKHFLKIRLFAAAVFAAAPFCAAQTDTITVDRAGRGDFRSISAAVESVRAFDPDKASVIFVRNGFYKEKIVIPTHIQRLSIIGESRENTIINYDDHANIKMNDAAGDLRYEGSADRNSGKAIIGTFRTYTMLVRGSSITLENLTIENSAEQIGQAVALHLEGDKIIVRNCRLLGNQDTFYGGRGGCRQYFENCCIEGTTDFIFGPSTVWFEKCEIRCKKNSFITAASTPEDVKFGFIFNNCKITVNQDVTEVYLGRPWRSYAMTVFQNCELPSAILPVGWENWRNPENEKTARYFEFNNFGAGANTSKRAAWTQTLKQAVKFSDVIDFVK